MRAFLSLFFCVGITVSAQEQLDFENRHLVPVERVVYVSINVFVRPTPLSFSALGFKEFYPDEISLDALEEEIESDMLRLNAAVFDRYQHGTNYEINYVCLDEGDEVLFSEAHRFVFNGSVPDECFNVDLSFPLGHFHVPGIERAQIRVQLADQSDDPISFADSDVPGTALQIVSDVVKFDDGVIDAVKRLIADGTLNPDAHILFTYVDGSKRRFDLSGTLIAQTVSPTLTVRMETDGFVLTLSGEPQVAYTILEAHDLAIWTPWQTIMTDMNGHAEVTDTRGLECRFFRIQ